MYKKSSVIKFWVFGSNFFALILCTERKQYRAFSRHRIMYSNHEQILCFL